MAQRLIDDEGLARRTRSRWTLIRDISVSFSRYEKMQEFGLIKIFTWKHLAIRSPVFLGFFRAQSALLFVSTLNSFQGSVEGQHLVVVVIYLCRGSWQGPTFSQQGPFMFDHVLGAFHGHCVPRCWEGSFPGLTKIPLTGHSMCCH